MSIFRTFVCNFGCPVSLLLLSSTPGFTESKRDLGSHEHGASTMNIVMEDNHVYIEFESPWANLTGFEHQPGNPEQLEDMSSAFKILGDPEAFLTFSADANCFEISSEVKSTIEIAISETSDSHDEHTDKDDEHSDDEHSDDEHSDDEHSDDEHSGESGEERHSEVMAEYVFECIEPGELADLSVGLFEQYSGIEDIDVQLAGPGGQTGMELNPAANSIDLSAVR